MTLAQRVDDVVHRGLHFSVGQRAVECPESQTERDYRGARIGSYDVLCSLEREAHVQRDD